MLSKVYSASVIGIEGYIVTVEVDISPGMPVFSTVGLPDRAVSESKERVISAIRNSGFDYQHKKITVNLAPADIKKEGGGFDLPIAIGILSAENIVKHELLSKYIIIGELALDGTLRELKGILPISLTIKKLISSKNYVEGIILPAANAYESAVVDGIKVIPVTNLKEAIMFLNNEIVIEPYKVSKENIFSEQSEYEIDFNEVKGQEFAKRALEIACAGGHNVIMIGPPGTGKSMLAKRIPTILPPLTFEEALETTKIHSVAGLLPKTKSLLITRPFRAPHHTISNIALIGGGVYPKPGEVSLAHNGILFLDELPEFHRDALEVLRQPLETHEVCISRANSTLTFPANFMLVAAMNPCPCGYYGSNVRECNCNPFVIQKYMNKISGPLLDRIDIHLEVPSLKVSEITDDNNTGENSKTIRERVINARKIQLERFKNIIIQGRKIYTNSQMNSKLIRKYCKLNDTSKKLIKTAIERLGLSARAYDRILKVARTIADIENKTDIESQHISEAIQYRTIDRFVH